MLISSRMNYRAYNVPQYYHSVWYNKNVFSKGFTFIKYKQLKASIPVVLIVPYLYAHYVTDTSDLRDEDYEKNFKVILADEV